MSRQAKPFPLEALRKSLGFTQAEMAARMAMGARAYFTLEQDPSAINARHVMLAERVALEAAVERKDPSIAPDNIAKLARAFAKL